MTGLQISRLDEAACRVGPLFATSGLGAGECLRKTRKRAQNRRKSCSGTGSMWLAVVLEPQLFSQGVNLTHG